ncbi:hypothetical protein ROHU_007735 [Labeo rohita]|uniref:Uncharacterized protein n=1 Tax=Labeo rohita TaxID=84645 RepID=A0A498MBM5_LABRO|nr:hypothetical protein ROHU_007735 [Labeo rohita]
MFWEAKRYEEAFVRFLPCRAQASGLSAIQSQPGLVSEGLEARSPEGECGALCPSSKRLGNGGQTWRSIFSSKKS